MFPTQTSLALLVLAASILGTVQAGSTDVQSRQTRQLLTVDDTGAHLNMPADVQNAGDALNKQVAQGLVEKKQEVKAVAVESVSGSVVKMGEVGGGKPSLGFTHGFVASLSMIVVSELGDKTFFIAAIMAMTHSRITVLMGAIGALFAMTILSALVGYATTVIPRALTYYISSALFAIFGLKMLREGWAMSEDEGKEEYEEVQADLKRREDEIEKQNMSPGDVETGTGFRSPGRRFLSGILSTVFLQSLTLTFLAEWGDRSQIATIILGAREDVFGVILGGCLGHFLCTGLAVVGGRFVAQRISVRTVTLLGGVVFLIFALSALWFGPGE